MPPNLGQSTLRAYLCLLWTKSGHFILSARGPDASEIEALQTELETIVRAANIVPMRSSELFFELKSHIDHTRSNLASAEPRSRIARVA